MAILWQTLHQEGANNAEIAASGSETFFSTNSAKQAQMEYGQSFNALELNNDSNTVVLAIDLDGLVSRRRLIYPKSSYVILPEDGIFFNTVKATNTNAADALTINQLRLNARLVKPQRA